MKLERRDMKESRRRQKCAPSLISLVNMSAGFILPATCLTKIVLSRIHSCTEFLCNSICSAALEVILWDHLTHASLSLYSTVGPSISKRALPESEILRQRFQKSTTFLEVAQVAQISASQELSTVRSCWSPSQPRGPPFLKTIPPLML